jgi:hypothetical protein
MREKNIKIIFNDDDKKKKIRLFFPSHPATLTDLKNFTFFFSGRKNERRLSWKCVYLEKAHFYHRWKVNGKQMEPVSKNIPSMSKKIFFFF